MVRTEQEMTGVYGPVLLTTQPAPGGFISRYLLGLTPVIPVIFSLIALVILHTAVSLFPPSFINSLRTVVPDLPGFIEIGILLIAPGGIFLFFIYLGDVLHSTELWAGASLTLLLSGIGALVMVQDMNFPLLSARYLLVLFQWIAYLVQPFSLIASVVVITGIELFRRTIRYTITRDVVIISGGIWNLVENVIPLHQIEKLVLVQSRLGHFFHFGTVVLKGLVFGNTEIDLRGIEMAGDMEPIDTDKVSSLRWQKGSHNPLICLYGVRDPESVKVRLEKAIQQISQKS
ncbi:MAG TPA: PH domain-containing protein [Methanoregula sp.]|nr:PH domain-containing protein [Methanoregula sp.]